MKVRNDYLSKLLMYKDTEFIKVITGVRRSGKSFIMKMFQNQLIENGVNDENIIYINFEHPDMEPIKDFSSLNNYIKFLATKKERYYFLFDEIQEVKEWQKVINGLRVAYDSDIYITGSNARLLSGELTTYLSGRYVEIKVMPLSFVEFLDFKNYKDTSKIDEYYNEYLEIGAFPSIAILGNRELIESVLQGIFDSIILKDISLRGKIKDTSLLFRIVKFLMDNIGNPVSSNSISKYLTSSGRKTTNETVDKYLSLLVDAFIFYKIDRFDIRGKERLKTLGKYYVVDLGIRNTVLGQNRGNFRKQLENIVFLELLRRGYEISVGKLNDIEIDFVCTKPKSNIYIQVAQEIPQNNKRETKNLLNIPDNYKKLVITANRMETGVIDGIDIIYITDFLLNIVEI